MTKVFDISLQAIKQVTDYLEGTATDGSAVYLKDVNSLIQANQYWDRGTLWIKSSTHANKVVKVRGHASNKLTFDTLGTPICVQQVETATVVGTIGAAGAGNATVIVTAVGMAGSPKTISVAVANNDTASQVATKIRTALAADTDAANFFTISGADANVILTTKTAAANDTTLNVSIANGTCSGLTAAPTSANTTAGVAGPRYCVVRGAYPWEQMMAAMQNALDETHVTGENEALIGDGTTLEFVLPTDVYDIKAVELERPGIPGYQPISTHWDELPGKLKFTYGYAPYDDDIIHIYYKKPHDAISTYSDTISTEIDRDWLALTAAKKLLYWGAGQYGQKSEYMIEERMNDVLNALKGKTARLNGPDLIMKTAGG
jgi:hypothetical protein